jgi:glycosyltransferase involved in cell wall biosynthesis
VRGISAVIPAYNEERAIAGTVEAVVGTLEGLVDEREVVVVDDRSGGGTAAAVRGLVERYSVVRLVARATNRGHGAAPARWFAAAGRELPFLVDGDKQVDPGELGCSLPLPNQADLVVGSRRLRADPLGRRLYGWGRNRLVNILG